MKKLLLVLAFVGMTLTACKPVAVECDPGFHEENGECVPDDITCDDGFILDGDECVPEPIECEDGYVLDGDECVLIDQTTELERAFDNTIDIDNYRMDVVVTEGVTTLNITLLFDGQSSSIEIGDDIEYFQKIDDVCYRVTEQLDNVITEEIDCIATEDTRFQFFHGFEIEWFEPNVDEDYVIVGGEFNYLSNFFRQTVPGAVVSDFVMTVSNDYFHTFTFDVTGDDGFYQFDITLSAIGTTTVDVPSGE